MTQSRETDILDALVTMASALARGYDIIELLQELVDLSARLLDVESAGLLLADRQGVLHVLAASSDETLHVEVVQLQRHEGPCLDCYQVGEPVSVPDLDTEERRWPRFVAAARAAGFVSVHALPLRLQEKILGTLGLFGRQRGKLNDRDHELAQALADVASVSLIHARASQDADLINQQLQVALDSRITLEQAKGVVAQAQDLDMSAAFAQLRSYARRNQLPIQVVAQNIVDRTLRATELTNMDPSMPGIE